jgi:hypothetical protein
MSKSGRRKIWGYLFGLGLLVGFVYLGGLEAVRATLTPRLDFLLLYFLSNLLLYGTSSVRWGYIVNKLEGEPVCSQADYFLFFMSSRGFLGKM